MDHSPKPQLHPAEFPRSQPRFRLATEADIEPTFHVYLEANQDLNRRIGRIAELEKHTLPSRALAVRRNGLRYDPERFWIAEYGHQPGNSIAGFGLAIRRRSFWYLAALHVLPEFQGCGVGSALVRHCLGDLDSSEHRIPLLTTSDSANFASTGMYMRFGLLPQTAILQLQGPPRPLGRCSVTLRPTDPASGKEVFDRLDQIVLGEIRPEDHQCWATVPSMIPYIAFLRDRVVGYIYIDGDGALGPAAVELPEHLAPILSAAFETYAAGHSNEVQIRIAASARDCLTALFSAGFSCITEIRLLLTSCEFGRLDQYLFSGADALF